MNQEVITRSELSRLGLDALDKDKAGRTAISRAAGGVSFVDAAQVMEFAKLMAIADKAVPKHLRANPGACLRIVFQAVEWAMSPWAVADKSYEVNDRIAYESQLIHAVVEARAPLQHRLDCKYDGELFYDETEEKDKDTGEKFTVRRLNWRKSTRTCTVIGHFTSGDTREYTTPKICDIRVKNSPLWRDDPDQQLFYFASRSWARKWCPDVLNGIYSREELESQPQLGREGDAAAAGLHARLVGSEPSSEGHRDGHVESELDQVVSEVSGAVIDSTAEGAISDTPEAKKRTSDRPKGSSKTEKFEKSQKEAPAKAKAKPKKQITDPKNASEYVTYAEQWIGIATDDDDMFKRWNSERKLRNDLGVTSDDRAPLDDLIAKRREELNG